MFVKLSFEEKCVVVEVEADVSAKKGSKVSDEPEKSD